MKTIGLIGGMSWESTSDYYRIINTEMKKRVGGFNSAKIALYSVNFGEIEKLQCSGDWEGTSTFLIDAAQKVEKAGADFLLICTNTMHIIAEEVEESVNIPLIHIADATGEALITDGIKNVGLLGTSYTMEKDFYKGRLTEKYGLNVIVPDEKDRKIVNDLIYKELCLGIVKDSSRDEFDRVVSKLSSKGCEAVILGCTEIGILLKENSTIPLYDTTKIHATKAVDFSLSD
ncbi:MAG: aspartate/glutamate racemase family protein [Desulfobacterales bacterium]|nr:aspartate/glutamate racemase family protein [Desulfobacterales bacterium]MCP4163798.1 aspartate/glutamate racemase family protein [Deltaproteobacteria bacterium]